MPHMQVIQSRTLQIFLNSYIVQYMVPTKMVVG